MSSLFPDMPYDRWRELEVTQEAKLTHKEIRDGWHFCPDWDGMLVNKYDTEGEGAACQCGR